MAIGNRLLKRSFRAGNSAASLSQAVLHESRGRRRADQVRKSRGTGGDGPSARRGICSQWAEEHFQREGVASRPPWHYCSAVATDPSGTRMLLRFDVLYAWGYSQLLVAVREAGAWRLRLVVDGEHYHLSSGR